ncbi:biotin--[acetyl-CoA-carboxylase] ligase [Marinospirillum sp.]|uniref:biotin--[acetyl-CoA-carboxylase] ligase n=1 Tax=Marinospirillum sp. TaxID=2183934 RepID=UPI00384D0717
MNLYPLICQLSDGQYHTGTELGESLNVSRTAIWKQIQKLPELGLRYQTEKQLGYRLETPLDLLDADFILDKLRTYFNEEEISLSVEPVVTSTNTLLLDRANSGDAIHLQLLTAEMQQAGKGRRGRNWFSPFASSISCSLGWVFEGSAQELQGLSLAIGVAIKSGLENLGIKGVGLKWPNDIYLNQAKLGGILIEITGDLAGPCKLVVGFGLNVHRPVDFKPEAVNQPVAFLSDLDARSLPVRSELVAQLYLEVLEVLSGYAAEGFAPWVDEWNQAHIWQGQKASVITPQGSEEVTLGEVNQLGELQVFDSSGEARLLNSGEISLRLKDDT